MLVAAVIGMAGSPAMAQSAGETIDVGGWKVSRRNNPDGSFKQCNSVMTYDDNSVLGFVVNAAGKVFVVVVEPTLKLTEGQTYKAGVTIDKGATMAVDGVAAEPTMLVIPIANDDAFMPAAIAGDALFVEFGGMVHENPLTGSGKAITQLGACATAAMRGS